jgi:hypothetical protein
MVSQGFHYRSTAISQDISLRGFTDIKEYLGTLGAKRRNDILQAVRKVEAQGVDFSINIFRRTPEAFQEVYSWYFDVYRPYASAHFPNDYKDQFIEDLHVDVLKRYRYRPFVFATTKWKGKIIGASFLRHVSGQEYQSGSSARAAWGDALGQGDVLQMFMLNSWHELIGNINTYIYYRLIEWCLSQGYDCFSFGGESIVMPPEDYLNVMSSKRAWGTRTILRYNTDARFVLCNRKALLYLRADYFIVHRDTQDYHLTYFANDPNSPKFLSQWLSGDPYLSKCVYARERSIFSYLEKRAQRWKNTRLVLCNSEGVEEQSIVCP